MERRPGDCGIDEAGRGAWAGPVVVAAVILPEGETPAFDDSKRLSPRRREEMAAWLRDHARWSVAFASREEVDEKNVLRATLDAMASAASALEGWETAWVDGPHAPESFGERGRAIIGGDGRVREIAAASILAKVTRDQLMRELSAVHPPYGFERHVGYGTAEHAAALSRHGPCDAHRLSFAPVREAFDRFRGGIRT